MNDEFPVLHPRCPFCAVANGRLYAVKYNLDMKTLTFRCEACARNWEAKEYSPSMESQRKVPDRHTQH